MKDEAQGGVNMPTLDSDTTKRPGSVDLHSMQLVMRAKFALQIYFFGEYAAGCPGDCHERDDPR